MVLKSDQERVKALLSETITLLCRNGLHFQSELSIEALIGITLDQDDVFLVSVKEVIQPNSNPVDSPSNLELLRKQKIEDVETIQLDAETGDLSAVSDSTPAGRGLSLTRCAGPQPTFYSENAAGEKVTEAQKKKRRRTIDTNLDGCSIENKDGQAFSQSRIEVQTGSDILTEGCSSLGNPERVAAKLDGKEAFSRQEETAAKSDIFDQDFGTDVIHIKEEAFSVDDGMQYYNPSASFSAYPSHFPGMPNDASPFETAGHPFQVSEQSASHLANEVHSQRERIPRCHQGATWNIRGRGHWRMYDCSVCGRGFTSRQGRDIHRRIHDGIYRYHCVYCGKGCSGTTQLRGHMAMHAERKEFQCSACDKQYRYKQDLLNHFRKYHDDGTRTNAERSA